VAQLGKAAETWATGTVRQGPVARSACAREGSWNPFRGCVLQADVAWPFFTAWSTVARMPFWISWAWRRSCLTSSTVKDP
jgi:hypothetical protein